jgi:hypothetical protein
MVLQCGYSGTQVLDGNVIVVTKATVAGTYGIRMVTSGFKLQEWRWSQYCH